MDGLPQITPVASDLTRQTTLKASIDCVGVGLHCGKRVRMTLRPAQAGHGIVFRRTDLGREIPARYDHVSDAHLATSLADPLDPGCRVGTVEHLLAALAGSGIDNVLVELDGPEVPIFDGSASPFLFLIDCAGIVRQDAPKRSIEVLRPVRVSQGDSFVELQPPGVNRTGLDMSLSIEFAAGAIGRQSVSLRLTPESFRHQLARARTFALAEEVDQLRAAGLAQGGSLDNALVVDADRVLNPGGLRLPHEFARHKLLDAVGDLALAGASICARFVAQRSGHALNNRLLRALFADQRAWREAIPAQLTAVA